MENKDIFKITITEENSLKSLNLKSLQKLCDNIYLAFEGDDLIIYDFQKKAKLNTLKFHSHYITSIHLCKKPFFVDNNLLVSSNNVFFVLSASLDKKFAMHKIIYEDNLIKFELIARYSN